MAKFKWENLGPGGETFQALIAALVLWENRDAIAFRKQGKDCGIDAISGDKRKVIQAKYRSPGTVSQIITAAKKEYEDIRNRMSEESCSSLWRGIKQWELITNVEFSPANREKWDTEIEPLFAEIKLEVELTEKASLEARLLKFPDLCSAFFGGQNRVFQSLAEIRKQSSSIAFDIEALKVDFVGHEDQLASFKKFIKSDKRILLIRGIGGIGKSRFLLEAADSQVEPEWLVLWANTETMSGRSDWLKGIPLGRNTLLCLDDPPKSLVAILLEQASIVTGAMAEWKIAIAARDSDIKLNQLLNQLPPEVSKVITLGALQKVESEQLAIVLLKHYRINENQDDWLIKTAEILYSLSGGIPLWITTPVRMLKEHGDLRHLPEKTGQIAEKYIREASSNAKAATADQILLLLKWLALLNELNIENESILKLIVENTDFTNESNLKRTLHELTTRGILFRKGIRDRLFFIKPDPLADQLLEEWLIIGLGSIIDVEKDNQVDILCSLVEEAVNTERLGIAKQIATGLIRCGALIKYEYKKEIELLKMIYNLLEEQLDAQTVSSMLNWLTILEHIAPSNPSRVLDICTTIYSQHFKSEKEINLFSGETILTESDIFNEIPWLVYVASEYVTSVEDAQKAFNLLISLVKRDALIDTPAIGKKRVKGKSASALLSRILSEDQNFSECFTEITTKFVIDLLNSISEKSEEESTECISLMETVIAPLLAEEHMSPKFDRNKFVITRTFHGPGTPTWNKRKKIKEKIQELLKCDIQSNRIRLSLWKLLKDTHISLVRSRRHFNDDNEKLKILVSDQKEDLKWLHKQLLSKSFSVSELRAAMDIWDWHVQCEEIEDLKRIAESCEAIAKENPLFTYFQVFTDIRRSDDIDDHSKKLASWILKQASIEKMISIIREAAAYFENQDSWGFSRVAEELGRHAKDRIYIEQLANKCITQDSEDFLTRFAFNICFSWLITVRDNSGSVEAAKLLKKILSWCSSESCRIDALISFYNRRILTNKNTDEIRMLREFETLFSSARRTANFLELITYSASVDFKCFRDIADRMLDALDGDDKETATYQVLHSLNMMTLSFRRTGESQVPKEIIDWILNRIVILPQMSIWNDNTIREVREILKDDQPDIQWLCRTLKERVHIASSNDEFKVIPIHSRISEIVRPLPESGEVISDEIKAVKGILGFIENKDFLGYELPKYLNDIDPYGRVVPIFVSQQLKELNKEDYDSIWKWIRIASVYEDGSPAWRIIAEPACDIAVNCDEKMKKKIWNALIPKEFRSWSAPVGQISKVFYEAIEDAEKKLETEEYPSLKSYREWVLEGAKLDLEHEEQRLQEEEN